MDKVKLNIENIESVNKTRIMIGDQEIEVRERITSREREDMAVEYGAALVVIDEEKEMAYLDTNDDVVEKWLLFKYYTNVDTAPFEDDKARFYDLIIGYFDKIMLACFDDYLITMRLCRNTASRLVENYNHEHSIGHKLMVSLRGIIDGEDIVRKLAESKIINEEMINLIEKSRKAEIGNIAFPGFAKKSE